MRKRPKDASVPCDGCTACCRRSLIVLMPEEGDAPWRYDTVEAVNPLDGRPCLAIRQTPEQACIYLGPSGCEVYDYRPAICRSFDCRRYFLDFPDRTERRRMIRNKMVDPDVIAAGQARLWSLKRGESV